MAPDLMPGARLSWPKNMLKYRHIYIDRICLACNQDSRRVALPENLYYNVSCGILTLQDDVIAQQKIAQNALPNALSIEKSIWSSARVRTLSIITCCHACGGCRDMCRDMSQYVSRFLSRLHDWKEASMYIHRESIATCIANPSWMYPNRIM